MNDEASSDGFLPRVTIRKREGRGSFGLNFKLGSISHDTCDPVVKELLVLADDWTSYCITSLQFIPGMAEAGFFFVDYTIEEDQMAFLSRVSISSEERYDEKKKETTYSYIFHEEDLSEVAKKMETTTQMLRAAQTVQRSTLSSLIAEFDFLFSKVLKICSKVYPDRFYDPSEKITIGELSQYLDLSELAESRITQNISRKLRGSHSEYISWAFKLLELEKNVGAHASSVFYKDFLEVCQRRHVMAHNGGIINQEYVDKCKAAGLKENQVLEVGDDAQIDADYLRRATARVYLVGYYAIQLFIQTSFPKDRMTAFLNLLSTSHSFLENDQTKMAERIIDFAESSKDQFDHETRLKFGVNRTLTKLFEPKVDKDEQTANAELVLEEYDWSVKDPIFELVLVCLKRDFTDLIKLASKASDSGLSYSDAKNFVVFKEAREIEGFMECFPRSPLLIADGPVSE